MKNKILFIGSTPPPQHGVSTANETLLNSSLVQQFNVKLLDITDRRDLDNMGKLELLNILLALKHNFLLIYFLLIFRPNIIYLNLSQNRWAYLRDGVFLLITRIIHPKSKIVAHLNGGYFHSFYKNESKYIQKLIDITLKNIHRVIVVGDCLKYIFMNKVRDIVVVPNGVADLHYFQLNGEIKKTRDIFHVSFISNFFEEKGIITFIKAARLILKKSTNIHFHLAGHFIENEDKTSREIRDFLREYENDERVLYHGVVRGKEKEELLLKTHIFILPSFYHYEGHPLVLLEALSCGCVLISSEQGAIGEIVEEGKTGFILPAKNELRLAKKIFELVSDPDALQKMSRNARQSYLNRFTNEIFANNMINVFHETLS